MKRRRRCVLKFLVSSLTAIPAAGQGAPATPETPPARAANASAAEVRYEGGRLLQNIPYGRTWVLTGEARTMAGATVDLVVAKLAVPNSKELAPRQLPCWTDVDAPGGDFRVVMPPTVLGRKYTGTISFFARRHGRAQTIIATAVDDLLRATSGWTVKAEATKAVDDAIKTVASSQGVSPPTTRIEFVEGKCEIQPASERPRLAGWVEDSLLRVRPARNQVQGNQSTLAATINSLEQLRSQVEGLLIRSERESQGAFLRAATVQDYDGLMQSRSTGRLPADESFDRLQVAADRCQIVRAGLTRSGVCDPFKQLITQLKALAANVDVRTVQATFDAVTSDIDGLVFNLKLAREERILGGLTAQHLNLVRQVFADGEWDVSNDLRAAVNSARRSCREPASNAGFSYLAAGDCALWTQVGQLLSEFQTNTSELTNSETANAALHASLRAVFDTAYAGLATVEFKAEGWPATDASSNRIPTSVVYGWGSAFLNWPAKAGTSSSGDVFRVIALKVYRNRIDKSLNDPYFENFGSRFSLLLGLGATKIAYRGQEMEQIAGGYPMAALGFDLFSWLGVSAGGMMFRQPAVVAIRRPELRSALWIGLHGDLDLFNAMKGLTTSPGGGGGKDN